MLPGGIDHNMPALGVVNKLISLIEVIVPAIDYRF
jgi:hypothetical protein